MENQRNNMRPTITLLYYNRKLRFVIISGLTQKGLGKANEKGVSGLGT
jgi:hypothetical protein